MLPPCIGTYDLVLELNTLNCEMRKYSQKNTGTNLNSIKKCPIQGIFCIG
jgi:hypothetical protein